MEILIDFFHIFFSLSKDSLISKKQINSIVSISVMKKETKSYRIVIMCDMVFDGFAFRYSKTVKYTRNKYHLKPEIP